MEGIDPRARVAFENPCLKKLIGAKANTNDTWLSVLQKLGAQLSPQAIDKMHVMASCCHDSTGWRATLNDKIKDFTEKFSNSNGVYFLKVVVVRDHGPDKEEVSTDKKTRSGLKRKRQDDVCNDFASKEKVPKEELASYQDLGLTPIRTPIEESLSQEEAANFKRDAMERLQSTTNAQHLEMMNELQEMRGSSEWENLKKDAPLVCNFLDFIW